MRAIWGWLAGRKTYILAGGVLLVLLALVYLGRLTPETAALVISFAVPLFALTFRSALGSHQAQVLAVLTDVAAVGYAVRLHDKAAVQVSVLQTIKDSTANGVQA